MPDAPSDPGVRARYLRDVFSALLDYVIDGGAISFRTKRESAAVEMHLTIADGDRFHTMIEQHMHRSLQGQESEPQAQQEPGSASIDR